MKNLQRWSCWQPPSSSLDPDPDSVHGSRPYLLHSRREVWATTVQFSSRSAPAPAGPRTSKKRGHRWMMSRNSFSVMSQHCSSFRYSCSSCMDPELRHSRLVANRTSLLYDMMSTDSWSQLIAADHTEEQETPQTVTIKAHYTVWQEQPITSAVMSAGQ